ncbi:four-helix bundle copper-binding protein [Undibacterium sp. Ji22W]|uniref:four-helix bundle copper-binding protein n=1 Tax=Undibacterium sp. Ji22W TaxID=3413038 RepID=UPI003BF239B1
MNQTMAGDHTAHNKNMQSCIEACNHCHASCLHTAMMHCLEMGGAHVEATHFRLMMDCAAICQTSASMQLSGSSFHQALCTICADICEACAKSCETVGGMDACVKACHDCAASCRKMSAKAG